MHKSKVGQRKEFRIVRWHKVNHSLVIKQQSLKAFMNTVPKNTFKVNGFFDIKRVLILSNNGNFIVWGKVQNVWARAAKEQTSIYLLHISRIFQNIYSP